MINKDVIITLASRSFTILGGFLTSIITCRYLGPAGRGEYFFVITLAAFIVQFSTLGLHSSNTYFVAKDKSITQSLVANSLWISIAAGGIAAILTLVVPCLFGKSLLNTLATEWYLIALTPTMLFYLLALNLLVGLNEIRIYNLSQISSNVFMAVTIFSASLLGLSLKGFLLVTTLGWTVVAVCLLLVLLHYCPSKSLAFHKPTFRMTFNYSLKAYITCLLSFVVLKGNILLLNYYCGKAELGYFSIVSQVNDALAILPTTIALLLFPKLIRDDKNRWEITKSHIKLMALLMFGCCGVLAILAKPFVIFFFGKSFTPAIPILLSMLPGAFFLGVISIISQYLSSLGFPRQVVGIWLITFIIIILTSLSLIPLFAGIGAALALSITYTLLFAMISWLATTTNKAQSRNNQTIIKLGLAQ